MIPHDTDLATSSGELLLQTAEDWYFILNPLVQKCFDRLLQSSNALRRVVVLHPPLMPRTWEVALKQSLFNLGVPAVTMISLLDTPPLALEWKRGMVVHVGKTEAYCVAHADGMTLHNTMQITKAGYSQAVGDVEQVASSWTSQMDHTWLNHTTNPNSLLLAVAKCLEACPSDVRKHVAENIVFVGETVLIVPQLPVKLCKRLQTIFQEGVQTPELEQPDTLPSSSSDADLTLFPMEWSKLKALVPNVVSTGPYRADQVAWIGASLWATVWNRHDDANEHIHWTYEPKEEPSVGS